MEIQPLTALIAVVIHFNIFLLSSAEKNTGHFWQLTDLHWDQRYSTNGDPLQMCHSESAGLTRTKRSASKVEVTENLNGRYGIFGCDAPWDLVELSIKGMAANDATPDFIFWTGDNSPHTDDPKPDWSVIFAALRNISNTILTHMPNVTIFPVLGNHDVFPKDLYPINASSLYERYLTEGGWNNLLAPATQKTFVKCGYYSVEIKSNLKIIVLNTNLYNPANNLTGDKIDPCQQLSWFENQLQQANTENFKVMISAHIPPGYFERWTIYPLFTSDKNDLYVQLIHDYGHVIAGQVYGHTHTDSFRIFAENMTQIQSVAFMAPSVTPWLFIGGVNPGLRLYQYSSSGIEDYWQYYLNLSTTSVETGNAPVWKLLYQATTAYQVPDLSAANMGSVYTKMLTDPAVFDEYYLFNTAGYIFEACGAICIRQHLCAISNLIIIDLENCLKGEHLLLRHDPKLSSIFNEISHRADLLDVVPADNGIWIGSIALGIFLCLTIISVFFIRSLAKQKRTQKNRNDSEKSGFMS